jgi:hypothetical protein
MLVETVIPVVAVLVEEPTLPTAGGDAEPVFCPPGT